MDFLLFDVFTHGIGLRNPGIEFPPFEFVVTAILQEVWLNVARILTRRQVVKPFVLDLDPFRVGVETAVSVLGC